MADTHQEGDTVTNDAGDTLVLKNNEWIPTVATDAKKDIGSAAVRTGFGVTQLVPDMANMAAKGVNAVGNWYSPDWPQSPPGKAMGAVENFTGQGTSDKLIKDYEQNEGPLYHPQRAPTQIGEAAVQAAPFGLAGGVRRAIPNVARALLSGSASEAAGQATEGSPLETPARVGAGMLAYAAPGAVMPRTINPTTAREGLAQTMEQGGAPVSAADVSGGRLAATLEGRPPAGQAQGVSEAMPRLAGMPRAGGTSTFNDDLTNWRRTLGTVGDQLAANTSITAATTPQLRQALANQVGTHLRNYAGGELERPEVSQALHSFDQYTLNGTQPLSGAQYQGLHQAWSNSPIPEIRNMSGLLDQAMDNTHPGAWNSWRQNFADYSGLAAGATDGAGTLRPLDPGTVAKGMYRQTPMRDFAEASNDITKNRPKPYDTSHLSNVAHLAGLLGGVAGGGLTHAVEPGVYGYLMGSSIPGAAALASSSVAQPLFRSATGQRFMRNMDPKIVAALLAQQGVKPKGGTGQEQQAPSQ